MESIILITLLIVLLSVAVMLAIVISRALFWGEEDMAEQNRKIAVWRRPFIRGAALRRWAADATRESIEQRLIDHPTARTITGVTAEVEAGAVEAMLPLASPADLERVVACPAIGQGVVGLTAPEALAIATQLRATRSHAEVERIREMAAHNARMSSHRAENAGPLPCPLQGPGGICCVYGARPLHCRPLHARLVAGSPQHPGIGTNGVANEISGRYADEQLIAQGVEQGFRLALDSAGFDAELYELNSALSAALGAPNATERWAAGEDIFGHCHRVVRTGPSRREIEALAE